MKEKQTFAEKHPKINFLIGLLLLIGMVIAAVLLVKWFFGVVGSWIVSVVNFVEIFVNTSDQVIVVAMITGAVSITGVVISSIVAKIVEYKYNVKRYLYDKREEPYKQFVEMIYKIIEYSRAVTPQIRQAGNRLSGLAETACASLLA